MRRRPRAQAALLERDDLFEDSLRIMHHAALVIRWVWCTKYKDLGLMRVEPCTIVRCAVHTCGTQYVR